MMVTYYKLTDKDGYTQRGLPGETLWGKGISHSPTGYGGLCTSGVIHFYESPEVAALMDCIHGEYGEEALLWECRVEGEILREGPLKSGTRGTLTTLRQIKPARLTTAQRVEIAIRCALAILPEGAPWALHWRSWAEGWITGDRDAKSARAAAEAVAWDAAWAAAEAVAWAAARAASDAAWEAAAEAVAWDAAWAAARAAARAAAGDAEELPLQEIILEVLTLTASRNPG